MQEKDIKDLVIIGGGPAGASAAVYAARKKLNSAIVTDEFGGQSTVSEDIQNWIGFPHIAGHELAKKIEEHIKEYADDTLEIIKPDKVVKIKEENKIFLVETEKGLDLKTKALLLALGSRRRKLRAENADKFEHKGITYCASCDGPLFTGKDVIVVGGGNAGFESAAQLLAYVNSVTLLEFADSFKADPITVEKLKQNPKFKAITNAEIIKINGDNFVEEVVYKDRKTGDLHTIKASGVFVEIGMIPNTELVKDLVELDEYGRIKINPWTQRTSKENIWAAGDCTNVLYHQNNIASGDGVVALEDIYKTLKS